MPGEITAVAERAGKILDKKDYEIRKLGLRFGANFSKVEVLWALGNYFKHRDEWSSYNWLPDHAAMEREAKRRGLKEKNLKELKVSWKRSNDTVRAIVAAGLQASVPGNLRDGAKALGNAGSSDMAAFQRIVNEWAAAVASVARSTAEGASPPR